MAIPSEPLPVVRLDIVSPFGPDAQRRQAASTLRWFFSRISLTHLQKVRPGQLDCMQPFYLTDDEHNALWEAEWDRRTLLRPLEADEVINPANELLRAVKEITLCRSPASTLINAPSAIV